MVTEKFKEMALSFAGCDGGNLQSEVWFCGMEWGGSQDNAEKVASEFDAQLKPSSWQDEAFKGSWDAQYNQKVCWFLHYFYELPWEGMSYKNFVESYKIMYGDSDGYGFKMNMLPIRFKSRQSIDWEKELVEVTGFTSFDAYREWCVEHRSTFFKRLIAENQPKVVLCTGVMEKENFFRFFTGKEDFDAIECDGFSLFHTWLGDTLICVTPFFGGAKGINSYSKMESLVRAVKGLLEN